MINLKTSLTVDLLDVSVAEIELMAAGMKALIYLGHWTYTEGVSKKKLEAMAAWLDTVAEEVMKDGEVDQ